MKSGISVLVAVAVFAASAAISPTTALAVGWGTCGDSSCTSGSAPYTFYPAVTINPSCAFGESDRLSFDWGDGTTTDASYADRGSVSHTYNSAGTYAVTFTETCVDFQSGAPLSETSDPLTVTVTAGLGGIPPGAVVVVVVLVLLVGVSAAVRGNRGKAGGVQPGQDLARLIRNHKKIKLDPKHLGQSKDDKRLHGAKPKDGAAPFDNMEDWAHGREARTSPHGHRPTAQVTPCRDLLHGLLHLVDVNGFSFEVSEITGGRHSNDSSLHYVGSAVDITRINNREVSASNKYVTDFMRKAWELLPPPSEVLGPVDIEGHPAHRDKNGNIDHIGHVHIGWHCSDGRTAQLEPVAAGVEAASPET